MTTVSERVRDAQNSHDAVRMAALFAPDYRSAQPVHPGRDFTGREQVFANWSAVFEGVPDFSSELLAVTESGGVEWAEWSWQGHHVDGSVFAMRGVTILVIRDELIADGRLYMEPVEAIAQTIDESVEDLYKHADPDSDPV